MESCKHASTTLKPETDFESSILEVLSNRIRYKQLIGALMHLWNTVRPDITYETHHLARFMHQQTEKLLKCG